MIERIADRRHLSSFILSLIPYIIFIALYILLTSDTDSFSKKKSLEKEKRIKISMVEISISKVEKKVVEKKVIKKKIIKTIKHLKARPKPKPLLNSKTKIINKIIEKKPIVMVYKEQKDKIKEKELKIESEENRLKAIKEEQIKQKNILIVNNAKKEKKKKELYLKQNLFLAKLREIIGSNKTYPKTARRRNIQGDVKVAFDILKNGEVKKIEVLQGASIFHRSVYNAIEKSFPIPVDSELFHYPKKITLTMSFVLSH